MADLPTLPGVWDYRGRYITGQFRNPAALGEHVRWSEHITSAQKVLLWEAETSGGLLVAVPPQEIDVFHAALAAAKQSCWEIGEVVEGEGIEVD